MGDCNVWNANEIKESLDEGDTDQAAGRLQWDFMQTKPEEFSQIVNDLKDLTTADDNGSNDLVVTSDEEGNVSQIHINDGYLWDTKLFDKRTVTPGEAGAMVVHPINSLRVISRALSGPANAKLDCGK